MFIGYIIRVLQLSERRDDLAYFRRFCQVMRPEFSKQESSAGRRDTYRTQVPEGMYFLVLTASLSS